MCEVKHAQYELRDYNDATLLDAGFFVYDDGTCHDETRHTGQGMIHDIMRNSDLLEYLGHMLCEHLASIGSDERTIYVHDDDTGFNTYETTPEFCVDDIDTLAPYIVLRITEVTEED